MTEQRRTTTELAHAKHAEHVAVLAPHSRFYEGPFGRLFRNLPPWEPRGDTETGQIESIAQLAESLFEAGGFDPGLDNQKIPAGYTYLGQFIDHDLTFDPASSLMRRNDPERLRNFRTPKFDLDSLYGQGPDDQPYLYDQKQRHKFLLGTNNNGEPDLPRNRDASRDDETTDDFSRRRLALIGDPRNDENIIVTQVHLALLQFHNTLIDAGADFEEARQQTRWHYQWVVIHDFLKRLCGKDLVDKLLKGDAPGEPKLSFYKPKENPFMPVEFSGAAYRLGHSMIRGRYHLSDTLQGLRGGELLDIFGTGALRDNLQGGRELPPFWTIQWDRFVVHNASQPQLSRKIDTKLVPQLMDLPLEHSDRRFNSLPFRNLLRGWRLGLPMGQDVARRMGFEPIDPNEQDPLWVYVLKEAASTGRSSESEEDLGTQLGSVGAQIVAEVFIGLLAGDPFSYYAVNPTWKPQGGEDFDFAALLKKAGAPMTKDEADRVMNASNPS